MGLRRSGLPFAADEQAQLDALLRQAALALAYAEMVEALSTLNRELEERVEARTAQVLAQQRELITMEERQRLARDLHDSVKQTLFSLGLGVRAVRGLIRSNPAAAHESLYEQEQAVFQAQVEMGALLAQLRAPPHGPIDLARALAEHCAGLERSHALAVSLDIPPALRLPERPASELLRVAREALHNVIKHSGGASAKLRLAVEGAAIVVEVRDSGCGFDPAAAPGGMGLRGMGERVAALGGSLDLRSAPGRGTTVLARIPAPEALEGDHA
jgi:signal transduction histidine kinase